MPDNHDKKNKSSTPSEDTPPDKKKTKPSSTGKRSKIEVEALEAMLKKKKNPKPDSE